MFICILLFSLGSETEKPSARPDKWSSSMVGKMSLLMPALAANDFEFLAIVYCDVVAKRMAEGDVMTAIQAKLFAIQCPLQNVSQ
jgi:hypothetical protein